jgi:hypothetical protein
MACQDILKLDQDLPKIKHGTEKSLECDRLSHKALRSVKGKEKCIL